MYENIGAQLEKLAMRAEDKHRLAKQYGIIPDGAWKSMIREVRGRDGKGVDHKEGVAKIDRHRGLSREEWNKYVRDSKIDASREHGGHIDRRTGKIIEGTWTAGTDKTVPLPGYKGKRDTAGRMRFHLHPGAPEENKNKSPLEEYRNNGQSERYRSLRERSVMPNTDQETDLRYYREVENGHLKKGDHMITRPSGLAGGFLKSKNQYKDEMANLFRRLNKAKGDLSDASSKYDFSRLPDAIARSLDLTDEFKSKQNIGVASGVKNGKAHVTNYNGDVMAEVAAHKNRDQDYEEDRVRKGKQEEIRGPVDLRGFGGKFAIGHKKSNTMGVHSIHGVGFERQIPSMYVSSKFFDMGSDEKHKKDAEDFERKLKDAYSRQKKSAEGKTLQQRLSEYKRAKR